MSTTTKGGRQSPPSRFHDYSRETPHKVERLMDFLGEKGGTATLSTMRLAADQSTSGGFVHGWMRYNGITDRAEALQILFDQDIALLQRQGVIRVEDGTATLLKDAVELPNVNATEIDWSRSHVYRVGDLARSGRKFAEQTALMDAWTEVMIDGARSRKVGDETWTANKICERIEQIRGPVSEDKVLRLRANMNLVGYLPDRPILYWAHGHGNNLVLDGRHRVRAADAEGLTPTSCETTFKDFRAVLMRILIADEAQDDYDEEAATARWEAAGIDIKGLRGWRDKIHETKKEEARVRQQQSRAKRKSGEKAAPRGPKRRPDVAASAEAIAARMAAGEKVNVAAEARELGVADSTLRSAVEKSRNCDSHNLAIPESSVDDVGAVEPEPEVELPEPTPDGLIADLDFDEPEPEATVDRNGDGPVAESETETVPVCYLCGKPCPNEVAKGVEYSYRSVEPAPANRNTVTIKYNEKNRNISSLIEPRFRTDMPVVHLHCVLRSPR